MSSAVHRKIFREKYPQFANTPIMFSTDWCKQHRQEHGGIMGGACDSCPYKASCDQFIDCGIEIFLENKKKSEDD